MSMGLSAEAPTRTSTSPAWGPGVGRSPWRITSGLPVVSMKAAFMAVAPSGVGADGARAGYGGYNRSRTLHDPAPRGSRCAGPRSQGGRVTQERQMTMKNPATLVEYGAPID